MTMTSAHKALSSTGQWVLRSSAPLLLGLVLIFAYPRQVEGRPSGQVRDPASPAGSTLRDPFSSNMISRLDPVAQLHKYGFMTEVLKSDKSSAHAKSITEPLKKFQRYYGLNATGVLDNATLTLMGTPRCGLADVFNTSLHRRQRRYVLISRWRIKALSYRIGRTSKMSPEAVDRIIARAFKTWSDVSGLTFSKVAFNPIIDISFERLYHGDRDPFDGKGGVLAHAFFPQAGGDVHLDEDENWTEGTYAGVNLFHIIAHELGHSLGMAHTPERNALMYAYYRGYQPYFQLHHDDIQGIQTLYGKPTAPAIPRPDPQPGYPPPRPEQPQTPRPPPPNPRPYPTPSPTPNPGVPDVSPSCIGDGKFDAIFSINSNTYAIEGTQLYKLNDKGVDPGYPIHIQQIFGNDLHSVDTAIVIREQSQEYVYVFEGAYVWKFDWNLHSIWSEPRHINTVFPGLEYPFDSAFYSSHYKAIYFFKGSGYYRCSSLSPNMYRIDQGYPRGTEVWNFGPGVRVSAVFNWVNNGRLYVFSGQQYYRYDERRLRVDPSIVPYPRDVRTWWLGCKNGNIMAAIKHVNSTTNATISKPRIYHEDPNDLLISDTKLDQNRMAAAVPFEFQSDMMNNDTKPGHVSKTKGLSGGIYYENSGGMAGSAVHLRMSTISMLMTLLVLIQCLVLC